MTIIVIKVVAVVLITGWLIPSRVKQAETSRVFTCWNEILDHNTIVVTTIVMITILLIITVIKTE